MPFLSSKKEATQPEAVDPNGANRFQLDDSLARFNKAGDGLTWRDILGGGVLCLGDPGSGKTSGPMTTLVSAAHRKQASVVHTCVKPGDAAYWAAVAREHGRSDVRVFKLGEDRFNPLAYQQALAEHAGVASRAGLIENLTQSALLPMRRQQRSGGAGDPFWRADAERYVRHLVTIFALAKQPISFGLLADGLLNLAETPDEVGDPAWQKRQPAVNALAAAEGLGLSGHEQRDLELAAQFLLRTSPATPSRTRASTVATVCSALDPFLRGLIGWTVNPDAGEITWTPDQITHTPGVVIFDASIQDHGWAGATVQRLLLSATQDSILRRDASECPIPVIVVADEFQEFLDPEADPAFLRTARDRLGAMLLATQCVGNVRAACAEAKDPKAAADAVLGLCSVKVFAATSDPETMRYASEVFTHTPQSRTSYGSSASSDGQEAAGDLNRQHANPKSRSMSFNTATELQADVPHHEFLGLKRGGPPNKRIVEAYCAVTGRIWKASKRPSLKVEFVQQDIGH